MRINHNLASLNSYRTLTQNHSAAAKSLEKLSSGLRINHAGDDAAGLAISEKMRGQISGLNQASRNSQDAVSLIQTAEGGLNETHSILQRIRELAVQAANDTLQSADRDAIAEEVSQLLSEIDHISEKTRYNTKNLLDGTYSSSGLSFQTGANSGQTISLKINAMDTVNLGISGGSSAGAHGESEALEATASGQIASSSINGTLGDKVVDGSNITFDYSEVTAKSLTAANAFVGGDLSEVDDPMIIASFIEADGTNHNFAISVWDWDNMPGHQTIDDAVDFFKSMEDGHGHDLSDYIDVAYDDTNHLTFTHKDSSAPTYLGMLVRDTVGAGGDQIFTVFGLDEGLMMSSLVTTSYVTISNGTTTEQINVTGTDTSLTVSGSAHFDGLTIELESGKDLSDLTDASDRITVSSSSSVGGSSDGIDISTQTGSNASITIVDAAIAKVSNERAKLGAFQNRLEHTINNLGTSSENLTTAESRIRDADMASERMDMIRMNILEQASQAMLAQSNRQPQNVLQLLS